MVITKLYGKSWSQLKIPWSLYRPCIGLGKLQQHLTPCTTVSAGRASLLITLPFSLNSYPGAEPCTMLPQAWKHLHLCLQETAGKWTGEPTSAILSHQLVSALRDGGLCAHPRPPLYLLCLGNLSRDLWHIPGAGAPHLPQCPGQFGFFRPQHLRGAQSCSHIAASPGAVASPQCAHPAQRLSSSFRTS